jgi:putative FmdB family regulatory protein
MPVYEYQCQHCKNKFEKMRPFSMSGEPCDCPKCRKKAKRILSTCYSMSSGENGVPSAIAGTGGGCSSCSGGSCSSCSAS